MPPSSNPMMTSTMAISTSVKPLSLFTVPPLIFTVPSPSADCIIRLMIQIIVNGAAQRYDAPINVHALLENLRVIGKKVAVERNGEIVPKSAHASTLIADGDRLEIVVAVGGG